MSFFENVFIFTMMPVHHSRTCEDQVLKLFGRAAHSQAQHLLWRNFVFSNAVAAGSVSLLMMFGMIGSANAQSAQGGPTPSPAGAAVYFHRSQRWTDRSDQIPVHFGLRGMGVAPAGSDKETPATIIC